MWGLITGSVLAALAIFGILSSLSTNTSRKASTSLKSSMSTPSRDSQLTTRYQFKNEISDSVKSSTKTPPLISKLKTEYEWKKQAMTFDFERTIDGRTFITLVAEKKFSISLTTISQKKTKDGPLLAPYPDSTWFLDPRNCNNITGAWSITIDKCNRLWVLDTGHVGNIAMCNPKLLVFNLTDDELLNKYVIPKKIYSMESNKSVLINPVIETEDSSCDVKAVYMVDSQGYGLVMWNGTAFRHFGGFGFHPHNTSKNFNISGTTLFFPDGRVPIVLDPKSHTLFLAPLASNNLLTFTKTKLARMFKARSSTPPTLHGEIGIFDAPPTSFRFSTDGKIFFMGLVDNSIRCWRVEEELDAENIDTAIIDEKLQFISSIKIYPGEKQDDDEIWILVNSLQKTSNESRKSHEINSKILHVSMKNLIKDTHCK